MSRVKRGTIKNKARKNTLAFTKGFRGRLSRKKRAANEVIVHAGNHAFNDRREKKNRFRRLWTIKMNAALRSHGISYSAFIGAMKKRDVVLNRKMLAELAEHHPDVFARAIATVTK